MFRMNNLPVTMDVARTIQPMTGCKVVATEVEELMLGGLSPKTVGIPDEAGLLVFITVGG